MSRKKSHEIDSFLEDETAYWPKETGEPPEKADAEPAERLLSDMSTFFAEYGPERYDVDERAYAERTEKAAEDFIAGLDREIERAEAEPDPKRKAEMFKALLDDFFLDESWKEISESFGWDAHGDRANTMNRLVKNLTKRMERSVEELMKLDYEDRVLDAAHLFRKIDGASIFQLVTENVEESLIDDTLAGRKNEEYLSDRLSRGAIRSDRILGHIADALLLSGEEGKNALFGLLEDDDLEASELDFLNEADAVSAGWQEERKDYLGKKYDFSGAIPEKGAGGESYLQDVSESIEEAYLDRESRPWQNKNIAIFNALGRQPDIDSDVVERVMDWATENPVSIMNRDETALFLAKADPDRAIVRLIETYNSSPAKLTRELATSLLYRLEQREIAVNKDGAEYLKVKYDLGEYNDDDNVIQRLTNDGKVGIFVKDRSVARYFQAVIPETGQPRAARPDLEEITIDDLFYESASDTDDDIERKAELKDLFEKNYYGKLRGDVYEETGLYLSNFTLREQGAFVSQYSAADEREKEELLHLMMKLGPDGFRSLIALQDRRLSIDALVSLDASGAYRQEEVRRIFGEYAKSVRTAQLTARELSEEFFISGDAAPVDERAVLDALLQRSTDALYEAAANAGEKAIAELQRQIKKTRARLASLRSFVKSSGWEDELKDKARLASLRSFVKSSGRKKGAADVTKSSADILRRINHENRFFASVFRAAFKGKKEVDFENIRGVEMDSKPANWLAEDEKAEMAGVFEASWQADLPEATDFAKRYFESALNDREKNAEFHTMRKDGRVAAFARIEKEAGYDSGHLHAGSLVVAPEFHGSAMGEALWRKVIDDAARENVVHAEFFPETDAGTMYIERAGFVVEGVEQVDIGDGGPERHLLKMVRDDRANARFASRAEGLTESDLMGWADGGAPEGIEVKRVDFSGGRGPFVEAIREATERGLAMTRYFADPKNRDIRYVAFERKRDKMDEAREEIKKAA